MVLQLVEPVQQVIQILHNHTVVTVSEITEKYVIQQILLVQDSEQMDVVYLVSLSTINQTPVFQVLLPELNLLLSLPLLLVFVLEDKQFQDLLQLQMEQL